MSARPVRPAIQILCLYRRKGTRQMCRTAPHAMHNNILSIVAAIITLIMSCPIAHGSLSLTVNGQDPAVIPLELKSGKSIKIALTDTSSEQTSYDLTLSATNGVFKRKPPLRNKNS